MEMPQIFENKEFGAFALSEIKQENRCLWQRMLRLP